MSEQSYIFDFSRIDSFFEGLNIKYTIANMNGTSNKFAFVLSSYSYDNIEDCIDSNGKLKSEVYTNNSTYVKDSPLVWSNNTDGTCDIKLKNDVVWDVGTSVVNVKALFLVTNDANKYVLGFCINQNPIEITNTMTFDADTVLWTVSDGGYHG